MDTSQYLNVFMDECQEHLQILNQSLLDLEKDPENTELLHAIFRSAHTLKGASATMGFNKMANVTHAMEDVLGLLRKQELQITPEITNLLFDALDLLEALANGITEGREEDIEVAGVLQRLKKYSQQSEEKTATPDSNDRRKNLQLRYMADEKESITNLLEEGSFLYHLDIQLKKDCLLKGARAFMILRELESIGTIVRTIPTAKELEDEEFDLEFIIGLCSKEPIDKIVKLIKRVTDVKDVKSENVKAEEILIERRESKPEPVEDLTQQESVAGTAPKKRDSTKKSSSVVPVAPNIYPTVRVDIRKLDTLMNLIAELVINRSQIEQLSSELKNQRLEETVEHLNRLTIDLRDQVLKTRMVSIDQVFSRFPRLVRDLAKGTNKEVELQLSGVDTELDRTVIDEIGDPLVHIIRNCVDHGIEMPEEREAAGKPRTGVVSMDAYQTGNSVMITVSDDGKGMNPEKIAESALEKGFLTKDALSDLSDQDKINLIFLPGFSTAKEVSDVSGRGVGMDAVKNKISSLGGVINISTEPGQGTKFTIQLPLTLAIIQTLMIQLGEEVYAIPTSFVDQTISVNSKDIKILRHQEVTLLRGEVIPLLRLQDYLGIQDAKNSNLDELDVVVFKTGEKRVGCIVDSLLRQQDVVIKSLGGFLGEIPGIAGATILGDGRVALILDLRDVA